jgi:electron transfer flavoprotein alpha subunit
VANILVYIETNKTRIVPSSLRALEVARKICTRKGASLYAIMALEEIAEYNQDLISQLSAYKADKIILLTSAFLKGPPRVSSISESLVKITTKFPPVLFLFGATSSAYEISSFIASKLKGIFGISIEIEHEDKFLIYLNNPFENKQIIITEEDLERPVVGLISGEPKTVPGTIDSIEVIAFPPTIEENKINYSVTSVKSYYSEDTIVVVGTGSYEKIEKISVIALANEWPLTVSKQFFNKYPHSDFEQISSIFSSGDNERVILFGLSKLEILETIPFLYTNSKWLLINCEWDMETSPVNVGIWNDDVGEILEKLEESIY